MAMSSADPNNPGNILASAVDAEVSKFRELQADLQKLRSDLQIVLGQQTENEMVQEELGLLGNGDAKVYKQIGPVLLRQELDEAQSTVRERLEFIKNKKTKLESQIADKESKGTELATKISQMQNQLQAVTAHAVQSISEQHHAGKV